MNYFGIDFGTTNTAVVQIIKDDEYGTKTVALGPQDRPFSSIVAIPKDGGNPIFGREVREKREEMSSTHDIFTSMKSYLGTDKKIFVGEKEYSAVHITSLFLQYIKDYIKNQKKIDIDKASFSFPIDFSPQARRDLLKAAKKAGIEAHTFISESTACYISARNQAKAYSNAMIIDWGGGTLDISILETGKHKVKEIAVFGESVGGDNIDREIAKFLHDKIVRLKNGQTSFAEMPHACRDRLIAKSEETKIAFSDLQDDIDIGIKDYGEYGTIALTFTYDEFVSIVTPIIKEKVVKPIMLALERAGMSKNTISAVIVAGGSSNLQPFINVIESIFEDKIIKPERASWISAIGSATIDMNGGESVLSDNIDIQMSDGSAFTLFEGGVDTAGGKEVTASFALTEDAVSANFIFQNTSGKQYKTMPVRTKGYFNEQLNLTASIGHDQIVKVQIANPKIREHYLETTEFNRLTFYYDLSGVEP